MIYRFCFILCCVCLSLSAEQIETFYGSVDVEEPVLLELIKSPSMQRLKWIHQYGVSYYVSHHEEYSRYDHSLGVFAILRMKKAPLLEQIAGLLQGISHTVFSHVGDWIFHRENFERDYKQYNHQAFIEQCEIGAILRKYGYKVEEILPHEEYFPMLEQPGPALCASRIDYNIQGAYFQNFITREEGIKLIEDLQFVDKKWVSENTPAMRKLVRFSLFMTERCWGSASNYLMSRWLADAILRAVDLGYLSLRDIHFSTDQVVWELLQSSDDSVIAEKMRMLGDVSSYYSLVKHEEADIIIKSKFRGINPHIFIEDQILRMTEVDSALREEYQTTLAKLKKGWAVKLHQPVYGYMPL